ncbi:MAG TPA: shikimate kinase [Candidatus Sulfotelmatobacter sp.]|jgi:shikimate kinase|nr:shikimate kinase [Candidatus Sulfotelmatobacter sp.]
MNIILIGMRGSGKSTVGKILSKKTAKTFYDLDSLLIQSEGISITEIVQKYGWEYFREKESKLVERISKQINAVIAPGGGAIIQKSNRDFLGKNGKFIFLKVSVNQILSRISHNNNRPSLTGTKTFTEEIKDIWNERRTIYEQTSDITIDTDDKTPKEVVNEILKYL